MQRYVFNLVGEVAAQKEPELEYSGDGVEEAVFEHRKKGGWNLHGTPCSRDVCATLSRESRARTGLARKVGCRKSA